MNEVNFQMIDSEMRRQINEEIIEHFDNDLVASMNVETFKGACQDLAEVVLNKAVADAPAVGQQRICFLLEVTTVVLASLNSMIKESAHNTFRFVMSRRRGVLNVVCLDLDEFEEYGL